MALDKETKLQIIGAFKKSENDTGSPSVQIALLTRRINDLTEHLKINKKDHSSKIGLLKLVGLRKRLMRYLRKKDISTYAELIKELNLRDKI